MNRRAGLPGAEIIEAGLADLARDVESVPATPPDPEHRLYALLARDDPDAAHGRYNALIRRLVSYERALACGS